VGIGLLSVADWWLAMGRAVEEETEAAAAPATTIDNAMMRIVSFIVGNLIWDLIDWRHVSNLFRTGL
jgi:hypothetical protein